MKKKKKQISSMLQLSVGNGSMAAHGQLIYSTVIAQHGCQLESGIAANLSIPVEILVEVVMKKVLRLGSRFTCFAFSLKYIVGVDEGWSAFFNFKLSLFIYHNAWLVINQVKQFSFFIINGY